MNKIKRFFRSILISPLVLLVTLYILLEDFLKHFVKPFVDYISSLHLLQIAESFLQKRSPYTLLAMYICKLATFSSIKFLSLYLISQGVGYGAPLLVCGELIGAVLTVWYAKVALPILLTINKFALVYNKIIGIKNKLVESVKKMAFYQYAKLIIQKIKSKYVAIKEVIKPKGQSILKAIYRLKQGDDSNGIQ
jgi:hypothetical protein